MERKLLPLSLEQHQQVLYEILYMVDDFCRDHNIHYFLYGGSLLGAVRHQGIIPWDDDVDIAMTRDNYERFIQKFHASPVDGYELFDLEHSDGYLLPFAKVAKTNTWTSVTQTNRIHIDVLIIDGCGDQLEMAQAQFEKYRKEIIRFYTNLFIGEEFKEHYDCWKAKLVYFLSSFFKDLLVFFPMRFIPSLKKEYMRNQEWDCSRLSVSESKYSACVVWGLYGKGEVQPSLSFLNIDNLQFGERKLPVPSGWHEYLSSIYGDYMTPPPPDKRKRHLKDCSYLVIR